MALPDLPADPPPRQAPAPLADAPAEPRPSADGVPLGRRLASGWAGVPLGLRLGGAAVVLLLVVWVGLRDPLAEAAVPSEIEEPEVGHARAEYAAMLRQSPVPLGRDPALGALEPGDAEEADGRYVDYYAFEADSLAFSVLVTSDEFAPDLAVRRPDGQPVAASNLLRTAGRAEIDGLRGPGRFEVAVTSREPGTEGSYGVGVVPATPLDTVRADAEGAGGTLGRGPRRSGRFERAFAVAASPEAPVVLRVVSSEFVPRVHLFGPNGEVRGAWRTVERVSHGDSLHAVLVRYLPGWEAPYRLLVTSEAEGATGPFAVDARTVRVRDLRADGGRVGGTLGEESWLRDGRYVDTYWFRAQDGPTVVRVESSEVPPAVRLWRSEGRSQETIAEDLNAGGASAVNVERDLDGGGYFLEVLSGGKVEDDGRARGGAYTVSVRSERPAPPEGELRLPEEVGGPAPGSRFFTTDVRRSGESGGDTFEVGVTGVALSYPGSTRTRVQLSVSVRSVDYAGVWAPWESFAGKSFLVDGEGRRYAVSVAESRSPSGPVAEPGTVRRGTVVFYAPTVVRDVERLAFVPSIGERTLTLPIPVR